MAGLLAFGLIVLLLGPFVGLMAFLITYGEYSRHQFPKRRLMAMSLQTAAVSMAAMLALVLVAGLIWMVIR
ncbi:MAG: hypothetical protein ACUVX9_13790 [Anaerolineae bacterium]